MKFINMLAVGLLMTGCSSEYVSDTRIVVEGKINSTGQNTGNLRVRLVNQGILVSEGKTNNDGSFQLGGPGTTNNVSLLLERKIENFSSSEKDCFLDYDSLSIIIPENKNYIKFSNIIVE